MEKLLIAGGCGFVGRNIIELLHDKYDIIVLDRNVDESFLARFCNVKSYKYDFHDDSILYSILSFEKPDFIINLVSIVTAERDFDLFPALVNSNLDILLKFYKNLKNNNSLKLFIQFGSAEEYGNITVPYREDAKEKPDSPYAIVKLLNTNICMMLSRNYNFPIAVVRPGNIFGKYQPPNKLIPYLLGRMKRDEQIDLTLGEQKRDFIYIKDLVYSIDLLIHEYLKTIGQIINVSYGKGVSIKKTVEYLRMRTESNSSICFGALPYRENEMMDFECSIEKLRRITNIEFQYDLFSGLDDLLKEERGK